MASAPVSVRVYVNCVDALASQSRISLGPWYSCPSSLTVAVGVNVDVGVAVGPGWMSACPLYATALIEFPSVSLSYAIVAVIGHWLFNEPFGWQQIAGIVLIMGGVFLVNQH